MRKPAQELFDKQFIQNDFTAVISQQQKALRGFTLPDKRVHPDNYSIVRVLRYNKYLISVIRKKANKSASGRTILSNKQARSSP
jgi:hypothetical protein